MGCSLKLETKRGWRRFEKVDNNKKSKFGKIIGACLKNMSAKEFVMNLEEGLFQGYGISPELYLRTVAKGLLENDLSVLEVIDLLTTYHALNKIASATVGTHYGDELENCVTEEFFFKTVGEKQPISKVIDMIREFHGHELSKADEAINEIFVFAETLENGNNEIKKP